MTSFFIYCLCLTASTIMSSTVSAVPDFLDTLRVNLGDRGFVDISYVIEGDSLLLSLETEVASGSNQAWVGFGISERKVGSMKGSDIVTVTVQANGEAEIEDRHLGWVAYPMTPERSFPSRDDLQDWKLLEADLTCDVESCKLKVEISRKLDTGDSEQDRVIDANGKNRIIAARGIGFFSYHGAGRGSGLLDFSQPVPSANIEDLIPGPVDQTVDILMNNYSGLSNQVTTYACRSFSFNASENEPMDIVAFEPLLEEKNLEQLHHLILFQCDRPHSVQVEESFDSCRELSAVTGAVCRVISYAWAIGGGNLIFPENLGLRIGTEPGQINDVILQFHYDNPQLLPVVDNSGIRLHITKTLREHEVGILSSGDPFVSFKDLEPSSQCVNRRGVCPSECSNGFTQPVRAFMNLHHMHARGRQTYTRLNGVITSQLDYWDQSFQDFGEIDYEIKPGDVLETVCSFDTSQEVDPVIFGLASLEEMCQDFIYYYPRINTGSGCGFIDGGIGETMCDLEVLDVPQDQFGGDHLQSSFLSEETPCVISEPEPGVDVGTIVLYVVFGACVVAVVVLVALLRKTKRVSVGAEKIDDVQDIDVKEDDVEKEQVQEQL